MLDLMDVSAEDPCTPIKEMPFPGDVLEEVTSFMDELQNLHVEMDRR